MLVDSHCHLDFPDFGEDRADLLARADAAGVHTMLTISTHFSRADDIIALAESDQRLYCSVGIHPHEAGREPAVTASMLADKAQHPKVIGIGETGLDYHYTHSPVDDQKRNFRAHIEAARLTQLPLIVHARDADDDTALMLKEEMLKGSFPGLIHCFTAGPELARIALDLGFYISISGIVTFKSASALRDVIKTIPVDRLLVETDAPYLAPTPHRGKRNEPSFVAHTAACLAELKGLAIEDMAQITTQNFFTLFSKAEFSKAEGRAG